MQQEIDRKLQEQLVATYLKLAEALAAQDWEEIGKVNVQVNEWLLKMEQHKEPSESLVQLKRQLQRLHGSALDACVDECEKLRKTLLTQLEYAEGRSAYTRVDML
ncbi:MAG: hypothetical protein AAGC78_04225 [Cellvibrio sp.]|uniref:hypothetical protein n=1 Tax=Cellvibrio sp. TaxID=1965322 RepID=UPI0031B1EFB4